MNEEPQSPQEPEDAPQEPEVESPEPDEAPSAAPVLTEEPSPAVTYEPKPRLVRRPEGKLIAGVCTGLGAYTGIDPVAWRIGFVVLGLTTGIGIVAYIVAWLVMPMARPGEPVAHVPKSLNAGRWVGIAAIALGALVFAHQAFGFHTSWFWGVLLIGLGLALWGRDWSGNGHRPRPPSSAIPPTTAPIVTAPPTQSPPASPAATAFSTAPIAARTATLPLPPSRPIAEKRPPSFLGRLVVGACALAIGGALLFGNIGIVHPSPRGILAVLLGIIGAGLLVGTLWGRARWLIAPGVILALALTTVTAIPFNTRGGLGPASYTPTSLATLRRTYEHSAGPMKIDLSKLKFGNRTRSITVREGFGPLLVIVPKDVNVIAHGHVQGGPLNLFGHGSAGWDVSDTVESRVKGTDGTLRINTSVTFGPLLVARVGSRAIRQFQIKGFPRNGGSM